MNLLITGAFKGDETTYAKLKEAGFNLYFLQNEKDDISSSGIAVSKIDGAVCNGLFLYHDIRKFTSLKFIQLTSAGLDRVPVDYISKHGIKLFNARGVYSIPMAEYAVFGVLQLYKKSTVFHDLQENHKWEKQRDVVELYGKTVCVAGCGSVGTECAKRFKAFGCNVFGLDIKPFESEYYEKIYPIEKAKDVFGVSDVVVLTLPLTDKTEHFIDKDKLSAMKFGSILVNISRGKVVNESNLIESLKANLGGAVLDVFEEEPLIETSPLWNAENVVITPHNSFVGNGNEKRLMKLIVANLRPMSIC